MTTAAKNSWLALLATGGMAITSSMVALPAQASPCENGILIKDIATPAGYSCNLGSITYTFGNDIAELAIDYQSGLVNSLASISFSNFPKQQLISFDNLLVQGYVYFTYEILSPKDTIESVDLVYTPINMNPPPTAEVITTPLVPSTPDAGPVTIITEFESSFPPTTLTSLTHTIVKTPGPVPIAGVGFALAFSRKLRRRIHQVSRKRLTP